jgi:polysaccharide biosynthesis protein PslJ
MKTEYLLLGASLVVLVGVYLNSRVALVVLAVPASLLVYRVGSGGHQSNLSLSDLVLFIATLAALSMVRWERADALKRLISLAAVYFTAEGLSVIAHPNRSDAIEWLHQMVMVIGAMIVGFVIVDWGRARLACGLFLAGALVLGVWCIVTVLVHGMQPPIQTRFGIDKNFAGDMLVLAVLLAHINPPWVGLQGRWVSITKYVCVGGVLASQARQAVIGLVVVVVFITLRAARERFDSRYRVMLVALVPLSFFAYSSITNELHSGSSITSFTLRIGAYSQTYGIFLTSPLLGVGERYWYDRALYPTAIEPPNAEVAALATGGVIGLAAFLFFVIGAIRVLWKLPLAAGTLGLAMLLAHVTEGQFDIFWVTATGSLPWVFVGMSAAAAHLVQLRDAGPPGLGSRVPSVTLGAPRDGPPGLASRS